MKKNSVFTMGLSAVVLVTVISISGAAVEIDAVESKNIAGGAACCKTADCARNTNGDCIPCPGGNVCGGFISACRGDANDPKVCSVFDQCKFPGLGGCDFVVAGQKCDGEAFQ